MRPLIRSIASTLVANAKSIQYVKRGISNIPPPKKKRELNVLAQFQKPSPRTPLKDVLSSPASDFQSNNEVKNSNDVRQDGETFKTTSTNPVVSSIQEIPSSDEGIKVVNTLPAMKDVPATPTKPTVSDQARKEIRFHGFIIPPKPIPPGEEECCMSGCVNCVYTIYADDLELYNSTIESVKKSLERSNIPEKDWPKEIRNSKGDTAENEKDKIEEGVDPVMSAFLALENKLKKK